VEDVPVLRRALDDPEPLVRERAAWALARLPVHAGE
jgi:HEAT repeat protein